MTRIRTALRRLHRDERGFVTHFFIKTTIAFAIVAVAINEIGQILMTNVHAHNAAGAAAQAAADSYKSRHSLSLARDAAVQAALLEDPNAKVLKITVDSKSGAVVATVRETASTLVVSRVSFLQKYDVVHASEEESPNSM
jgi:Flp pilus assembly protein TadG